VSPRRHALARDSIASAPLAMLTTDARVGLGFRFRDSAFMENRDIPVHRWIPWIAGFSATFVEDCMTAFLPRRSDRRSCVLDPFAGVGTTLVAAIAAGHDAVGFEINPYAALACRVKVDSPRLNVELLDSYCTQYAVFSRNGSQACSGVRPREFQTRIPFFSESVERQVFGFQSYLASIKDKTIADIFRLAFGAVMVSFSNYSYEPSLCSRPGAGKPLIDEADVHGRILKRLRDMIHDIGWLQDDLKGKPPPGTGKLYEMTFMDSRSVLPPGSVDLVVTSPPYMNNYHYVRSTRPQVFWLGLVQTRAALRKLEHDNVGKYWQTVRDAPPVALEFNHPELEDLLRDMRSTRTSEGAYGGPGWANYVATYLNDSFRFLSVMKPSLSRGGTAVIVIGNSIIQGHEIKLEQTLADMAIQLGYGLVGVETLRTKRVGASITKSTVRRGGKSQATLYESAVIIKKR